LTYLEENSKKEMKFSSGVYRCLPRRINNFISHSFVLYQKVIPLNRFEPENVTSFFGYRLNVEV